MTLAGNRHDLRMWRVCFWVSTIPAALLALLMEFSTESPHWLYKELEKLFGAAHVKSAMAELSKSDNRTDGMLLLLQRLFQVVAMGLQVIAASDIIFVLTFSLGAGPVPGLLLSEILPSRIRAKAMAVCMSVHWQRWSQRKPSRRPSGHWSLDHRGARWVWEGEEMEQTWCKN
ncbi:hypothetical protein SASPL_110137 [Salvia splendens]|uniref:MFS transporter, SP family, solute carrier family 2 (Myo-inositol transporter), member 13 n=1 Tax=Salvia splendens TaxID=180675 RepID=A0A8X8Y9Y5_SALSN|nr:hypothetical protein SASPL_110137 [Salvia splendens]